MDLHWSMTIGVCAGLLAQYLMRNGAHLNLSQHLMLGVMGASAGGWMALPVLGTATTPVSLFGSPMVALLGAMAFIWASRAASRWETARESPAPSFHLLH